MEKVSIQFVNGHKRDIIKLTNNKERIRSNDERYTCGLWPSKKDY